jgi:ADP-heptose:LPS heptosyltransferase
MSPSGPPPITGLSSARNARGAEAQGIAGRPILVVRTDRLGDVILSLPVFAALRESFPDSRLVLLAAPPVAPLAGHPWIDELLIDDRRGRHRGLKGFGRLANEIRRVEAAAAIVLRPTWRNALVLAAAGVPRRIGTAFRAYSPFFTHRVRQHRRGSGRHEVDLNLELLTPLKCAAFVGAPWVPVDPAARSRARALAGDGPFIVLHPGSGGSAGEWPAAHFITLGCALRARGLGVVVTGIAAESELVMAVAAGIRGARALAGRTTLPELAALLAEATAVVAGSTGTLHLAAAVGTAVVGIYPDRRDASPERWAPRGPVVRVLDAAALGDPGSVPVPRDPYRMRDVSPESVLSVLEPWLERLPVPGHRRPG